MEEKQSQTDRPEEFGERESSPAGVGRPLLAIVIVTAVLYLGREILLPLTMATILAIIFSPIANRLERFTGRRLSAMLVMVVSVAALAGLIYFLTVELTSVAVDVASYSGNIATKLNSLKGETPRWLQRVENGIAEVERQVEKKSPPSHRRSATIQASSASPEFDQVVRPVKPVLTTLGEALLVMVLLFFLLYARTDLRDRLVRLAARGRITIASEAIDTAVDTVGHYLLLFSIFNLAFGILIGLVLWLIGLPNPVFWGGLAFLLRYIPYVGATASAVLPTLVAFAVFPGWGKSLEVLGSFIVLDQASAQFAEPIFIGPGIGLSPVALLLSAMYWSWLWGIAGLLLATPLTACLKVAGDYIPSLGFLAVLLGADDTSEDYREYYRRLLELDQSGARSLAIRQSDGKGAEVAFDNIIEPTLILAGEERAKDHISAESLQFIAETSMQIVIEIGDRLSRPRNAARIRVLGVTPVGEPHNIGLLFLLELLRQDSAAAMFAGEDKSAEEIRGLIRRFEPSVVCISSTMAECMPAALELIQSIKQERPRVRIFAGGKAAVEHSEDFQAAGCAQVCISRTEGRRAIRRYGGEPYSGSEKSTPLTAGGPAGRVPATEGEASSRGSSARLRSGLK
ncbi:MAG TPA: AI-2E family transporter [Candidatus Binataceae bacterium]|nr:AI-2E family transporter [Candidatus Binataceae bacterium]